MVRRNVVLQLQRTILANCNKDSINANLEPQLKSRHGGTGRGALKWIDSLRVFAKAGHGGNGHPKYGGIGGKGGDVIIKASDKNTQRARTLKHANKPIEREGKEVELNSLYNVFKRDFFGDSARQRLQATGGDDANRTKLIGQPGKDKVLKVS